MKRLIYYPRACVNQILTWIANKAFNRSQYVTDTINGFRALRRAADLLALETTVKRFPIEYQFRFVQWFEDGVIQELPTIEGQRAGGESKALSCRSAKIT